MDALRRSNILLWVLPWALLFYYPAAAGVLLLMLINNFMIPKAFSSLKYYKRWPVAVYLTVIFIYSAITGLWSEDLQSWAQHLFIQSPFLVLPLAFMPMIKQWKHRSANQFLASFHSAVVAAMVWCYAAGAWRIFGAYRTDGVLKLRSELFDAALSTPLMSPVLLSMFTGVAILISFYFAWNEPNRRRFWSFWVVFDTIFLFLLYGKMTIISFGIVAGVGMFVLGLRNKAWWNSAVMMLLPVLLFFFAFLFKPFEIQEGKLVMNVDWTEFFVPSTPNDLSTLPKRLPIWLSAEEVINDHLIIGVGGGDSQTHLMEKYSEKNFTAGIESQFNCHNQYLESMLSGGLVGLSLLLLPFVAAFASGLRRKRGVLISTSAYFMLCLLTESLFEEFQAVVLFSLMLVVLSAPVFKVKTQ